MSTTAEKLQKIIDIKNDLKEKINAKGGSITDTTPFAEYPTIADELMGISGGGSVDTTGKHKVTYFDLDGSELKVEYVEPNGTTTPPSDPSYDSEYLEFDCWNYDVANLVVDRDIDIGAIYKTITGDTYLFVKLTENIGLTIPTLKVTNATSIDWGDGTVDTNLTHTYTDYGDYIIKISGATKVSSFLFSGYNSVYSSSLKKAYLGKSVTNIAMNAFKNCNSITDVIISSGVTSIGESAFNNCHSLTNVIIPSGVTSIEDDTFNNCHSLTNVIIPSGVTSIGEMAFNHCSPLINAIIPKGVTSIGNYAFNNCNSLPKVTIPESVTSIGKNAFSTCCSLTNVIIPSGVTSIGESVFSNCNSITDVTISSGVTSIGKNAFSNCYALTNVIIPSGVTSIGNYAFSNCYSLANVTIPESVTSIGNDVFSYCRLLTNIIIPEGVTSIGSGEFNYCYSLTNYIFNCNTVPALVNTNAFNNINKTAYIWVKDELVEEYKVATNWSTFANYIKPLSSMTDKLREELGL